MKPLPVVKYSDFYKTSLPEDSFIYLRTYPTDLIILRLSKINAILFNEAHKTVESQQQIFKNCFPFLEIEKRKKVVAEFMDKEHGKVISFFTPPTLLKLINLCFENYLPAPEQEEMFDTHQFENDVFDSILIQNEIYYTSISDDQDLNTYEAIWQLQLMQQHYIRDHSELLMISPIKNFLFYKFMTKHFPGGPIFLKEFAESLNVPGFFNYYILFMDILQRVFDSYKENKESKHILDLNTSQLKIIEHFSLRPKDFISGTYEGNTHKELIPHPFYFALNKHPIILDFHFFTHVVDLALSFNFYKYSSLNGSEKFPKFVQFKSELGKSYYEQFIVNEALKNIYKARNFSLFATSDNSPLPDFTVVRNQREVVLIEVKSAEIHYKVLEELNTTEFKAFLEDQFCKKKAGKGTRNKGVYQLIKQIADFGTTQKLDFIIKNSNKKNKIVIYPIIIYTENAMNIGGVNSYLNSEFEKAVEPYRHLFKKIFPLTTINLSFFLRHYLKLKNHPAILMDLICSYWKKIDNKNQEFAKMPHPMVFFEKNISFELYVAGKLSNDDFKDNFKWIVEDLKLKED